MRASVRYASAALAVIVVASCKSANTPALQAVPTPRSDSLLACAERELFSRGYRVRTVAGNRLRLRAEPQLTALTARPTIIMVEYDPETKGLDVWAQVQRTPTAGMNASAEVTQTAWAVEDACMKKDATPGQSQ